MSSLLIAGSKPLPSSPPLESAVAADYERFDGLDQLQGVTPQNEMVSTGLGVSYGEQPDPGRLNAPYTRPNGIAGKVGSVGASPYPVATRWGPDNVDTSKTKSTRVSQLTTQFRHGPGAQAPGIAQTIQMTEIQSSPPQPGDLASILLGL